MPGRRATSTLAAGPGARFADVRWVAETGSTNADLLALARAGAPEGVVLVADHQTAGRGRAGRTWTAPPGSGLLCSILLRPPASVVELCTMAVGVAAVDAVQEVAGVTAGLKWPNDLVVPGDGSADDRKLAGILAESDWPSAVVVGIGLNVAWPTEPPAELAGIATSLDRLTDRPVDREDLLIALLEHLAGWYLPLADGDRAALVEGWRARSATLGRAVRVELGEETVAGTALDITEDGRLVVETEGGPRHVAVGDVVHLRPGGR